MFIDFSTRSSRMLKIQLAKSVFSSYQTRPRRKFQLGNSRGTRINQLSRFFFARNEENDEEKRVRGGEKRGREGREKRSLEQATERNEPREKTICKTRERERGRESLLGKQTVRNEIRSRVHIRSSSFIDVRYKRKIVGKVSL